MGKMRLGIMCSGNGTNFENIVRYPQMKHEVVLMIHNTKHCGAIEKSAKFGIPHCRIAHKDEDQMIKLFKAWRVDLIVLAGYMRVLKNPADFPCPIINVHPSLLPKYKGLHAVEQALESGDKESGCTVHYVNEELDGGTIIDQSRVPICPDDTVETLQHRIQRAEYRLLPIVINNLAHEQTETRRLALQH
tara:strand:+ start:742 stop:1311 length:570 start_codon:yes stop_codon:yes gene_type:complete